MSNVKANETDPDMENNTAKVDATVSAAPSAVDPAAGNGGSAASNPNEKGGAGGGCTMGAGGEFDPMLPTILGFLLAGIGWRRMRKGSAE